MNDVIKVGTYGEFKRELDREVKQVTEGFIRIGYLLKVARDTDVLQEGGYSTVAEFAQKEYGLTKDVVSRYIAINDRYSEGGYSDKLRTQFESYGVAKLAEMLTLPDSVIEAMSPELTRKEIQEIKKEIKEEEAITEVEVLLEGQKTDQVLLDSNIAKVLHQHLHDNPEQYIKLWAAVNETIYLGSLEVVVEKVLDAIAPTGIGIVMARVQGIGKFMLSIRGKDKDIELLNIRDNSKEVITWDEMINTLEGICEIEGSAKESWESLYNEAFPKKEQVAPVQPKVEETQIKTKSETTKQTEEKEEISSEISENEDEEVENTLCEPESEKEESESQEEMISVTEEKQETTEERVEYIEQEEEVEEEVEINPKESKVQESKKEIEKEIESIKTLISYDRFEKALTASEKLIKSLQAIIALEEE